MKLCDAIKNIDKSSTNEDWFDFGELCEQFDLYDEYVEEDEVKQFKIYWLKVWNCTDTWVGVSVLFLNDEPVAIREQQCQICDKHYSWLSKQAWKSTRKEVWEIIDNSKTEDEIELIDLDQEVDELFQLEYSGQPLEKIAFLDDEMVQYIGSADISYKESPQDYFHLAEILCADGSLQKIDVRSLRFPIRVKGVYDVA